MWHPTVIMRSDVVRRLGGYRTIFGRSEDYDLWLRMAEAGPIANLPDVLLDVRRHTSSVSSVHRRQQITDALAARLSALARRATGKDPFVDFSGPLQRRHLVEADVPDVVRVAWAAVAFLAATRHATDADPELLIWLEAQALQRHAAGDALFRERIIRARFSLARQAYEARNLIALLTALGRALQVSPRRVAMRAFDFAWRRMSGAST